MAGSGRLDASVFKFKSVTLCLLSDIAVLAVRMEAEEEGVQSHNEWELSKENIQPLKQGRQVSKRTSIQQLIQTWIIYQHNLLCIMTSLSREDINSDSTKQT